VERKRCTEDRRQVHCRITPAGLYLLAELDPLVERLDERIGEVLPPDQMQTLLTLLNEVIEACDARAFTESSEDGTA
jgi:DNA-binding MarR family transcriptional regulator